MRLLTHRTQELAWTIDIEDFHSPDPVPRHAVVLKEAQFVGEADRDGVLFAGSAHQIERSGA